METTRTTTQQEVVAAVADPVAEAAAAAAAGKAEESKKKNEPSSMLSNNNNHDDDENQKRGCSCQWSKFNGNVTAQGYNLSGLGRGPVYMASVFLSTALIYLASEEVGCVELNEDGDKQIIEDCEERVYGAFKPASLITNIVTICGVLSALFLPVVGAITDYTPHRKTVGIVSAILLILTELIQIGTTSQTWFGMAILEAVSGLIFEIQLMSTLAYLPEIARQVGQETMNTYAALFLVVEIGGGQVCYVVVVVAIAFALGLTDVATAQVAQAIVVVWAGLGFYLGWRKLPQVPALHHRRGGSDDNNNLQQQNDSEEEDITPATKKERSLLVLGFIQNWNTFLHINREFKHSIRWFLLALVFGEAAANAFITVAIIFLTEHLGLDSTEIGVFFVIALLATVLACRIGEIAQKWTNPILSWQLAMGYTFILCVVGALTLTRDNAIPFSYVWGFVVCLGIGWHYQAEYFLMSMMTPRDQEAEMAGFFNYCRIILSWLPPLLFSLLVEADVSQSIGVIVTALFFVLAILALAMTATWQEVVKEVHHKAEEQLKDKLEPTEAAGEGLAPPHIEGVDAVLPPSKA